MQPWFWIACLLLGGLARSMAFQSYVLTMTRALVRTESILTQLVFDFSLRVRVKAESSEQDTEAEGEGHESREATLVNTSEAGSEQGETDAESTRSTSGKKNSTKKEKSSKSFIGKLNNLATIDLMNVTEARDLALLCKHVLSFALVRRLIVESI